MGILFSFALVEVCLFGVFFVWLVGGFDRDGFGGFGFKAFSVFLH